MSTQADDLLSSAKTLMDISTDAAKSASETGALSAQEEAVVESADEGASQRLVLVRDDSKTTEQPIAELQADSRVVFAEPNSYVELDDGSSSSTSASTSSSLSSSTSEAESTATAAPASTSSSSAVQSSSSQTTAAGDAEENDETVFADEQTLTTYPDLTDYQWGNDNDGHWAGSGTEGIDVDYSAWNTTMGMDAGPVIAVIDTGVDETNPDLMNKMWRDGASYPSLVALGGDDCGWSAWRAEGESSTTGLTGSHGTHCAGVIGAEWNGQGTSGVSKDARIMSVRMGDSLDSVLEGFAYVKAALDAGVDVKATSNSWGFGMAGMRSISLAVTQVGQAGAVSIFSSNNDSTDISRAITTGTTLHDNPYAVVVDCMGLSGALSSFSNYGEATTDVLSPGSAILSTVFSSAPNFLGEADLTDTTVYESFDAESRFDSAIQPSAGSNLFSFPTGTDFITRSFDGTTSIGLAYDPTNDPEGGLASTNEVNLSALAVKPKYLSIRYSAVPDQAGILAEAGLSLGVRCTDGSFVAPQANGGFVMSGDAWSGFYIELPANTDWAHFQIQIAYNISDATLIGGANVGTLQAGTLCVDSIGLGSTRVPYKYMQGTSMACPNVTGAAAVFAKQSPSISAEKLAALIKGSTTYDSRYENLCLTSGRISVDASANPTASPISAISSGSTATITGYYFGSNPAVSIDGETANVLSVTDLGDDKAQVKVTLPSGFIGGTARIQVVGANGRAGNLFAYLGKAENLTYYDQVDMTWPDELKDWSAWQLMGFGGYIYCLPQSSDLVHYDHMLRYDPALKTWGSVAFPEPNAGVYAASAAVMQGKMYIYVESDTQGGINKDIFSLDPSGNWEKMNWSYKGHENIFTSTLASDGNALYLFGGRDYSEKGSAQDSRDIWKIDTSTGAFGEVGTMSLGCQLPRVAYDGKGTFLVANGQSGATLQDGSIGGMEKQTVQSDGTLKSSSVRPWGLITNTGQLGFAPATLADGFIIAGPQSKQDAGADVADTYALSAAEGTQLTKYAKRASDKVLLEPSACAYDGTLYVLAGTAESPNRVFSSTAVDTSAVDIAEASIEELPDVVYTGKAFEPDVVIHFGSQILTEGVDYTLSYENNVEAGTATVVATGTGRFSDELATTFEIVDNGSSATATTSPNTGDGNWVFAGVAMAVALAALAGMMLARRRGCRFPSA